MSLEELRDEIDAIDELLMPLLQKRLEVVEKMLPLKRELTDAGREEKILKKCPSDDVKRFYIELFRLSKLRLRELGFEPPEEEDELQKEAATRFPKPRADDLNRRLIPFIKNKWYNTFEIK